MKKSALISFGTSLLMPALALAQNTTYVDNWINKGAEWLGQAVTIIMVLLTVWFLISVFRYIAEKDAAKLKDKRKIMLNALIGLFIAVSVWGIIGVARRVLGTDNNNQQQIVCPPGSTRINNRCEVN